MQDKIIEKIIAIWADINPVAEYTSGRSSELTSLLFQTEDAVKAIQQKIMQLESELISITDQDLRDTSKAILVNQSTQLDLARPSGSGPSGTGAGGVYVAADGIFYIVLKKDDKKPWVESYLSLVVKMIEFEITRWESGSYTVEEKKECMNTVTYMQGTLNALQESNPKLSQSIRMISEALQPYQKIFYETALASDNFDVLWKALKKGDAEQGPTQANGYPGTLENYYTLGMSMEQVEQAAEDWMLLEMPVTLDLAQRIGDSLSLARDSSLP